MPSDRSQIPLSERVDRRQLTAFDLITPAFRTLRNRLQKASPGPRLPTSGELEQGIQTPFKGWEVYALIVL